MKLCCILYFIFAVQSVVGHNNMRTVIIGNAGSGKTWLAKQLATSIVNVVHLDDLFWMPGGFDEKRPKEEINGLIARSKESSKWIAEGVFGKLAEQYFDAATALIWLDIPWELCRLRLEHRGSESKIKHSREQSEKGLKKLMEWASHYHDRTDLRSHAGHQSLFNLYQGVKVQLKSEHETNQYIKMPNKALHRILVPLRSTRTGKLKRYVAYPAGEILFRIK